MRHALGQMAWLRDEHIPTLRKWAEHKVIRRAAFAGIVQNSVIHADLKAGEVRVHRLVHDYRQLAQTQLLFERELGMTPAARALFQDGRP
jgi:hypothetical protein